MQTADTRQARFDRVFYTGMAIVMATIVYVGFAPSYFNRSAAAIPLPTVLVVHGAVFTAWIVLMIAQTTLVAVARRDLHRRLGIASAALAATMVLLGVLAGIDTLRSGSAPGGADPRAFLAQPVGAMIVFAGFVAAGYRLRRQPEAHKRLMLVATISLLSAAFGRIVFRSRIPLLVENRQFVIFGLVVALVGAAALYDLATRGRVHAVYGWGAVVIAAKPPVLTALGETKLWLVLAESLL